MRYADLVARLTGLAVAVSGVALVGREVLVAPPEGFSGIAIVGPASVTPLVGAVVATGVALVVAGLAVLTGRGRAVAVSVGSLVAVTAVVGLAVGVGSRAGVLAVGVVAVALLLSGASTGRSGGSGA